MDWESFAWGKTPAVEYKTYEYLHNLDAQPKIMGIRMEHLLSGQRAERKKGTGQKVQYSPLIRGYKKDGITPDLDEWAWKFQWDDEFGTHRLGKGWNPFNAWDMEGGVRRWIDLMVERQIQAELGDVLDLQFVYPQPYYRQEEDVISWERQMIAEELRKFEAKQRLAQCKDENERRFVLDTLIPMYRHSCDYPVFCAAQSLCFDPGYAENPLASQLYRRREGHHDLEREALVEITKGK